MKVYIAAPYPIRDAAIAVMRELEAAGLEVTSTWLKAPDSLNDQHARLDLADVARADVLLALNSPDWANQGTGGRHVEFGYALALQIPIVILGARTNIFHHLSDVILLENADHLAQRLEYVVRTRWLAPTTITRENAVSAVLAEFLVASAKHAPMHSPHEGHSVIEEEFDELWDEVKADRGRTQSALREAVQLAAMGLRYITDLAPLVLKDPPAAPANATARR